MPVIVVSDIDYDDNGSQGEVVDFANATKTEPPMALANRTLSRNPPII